MMNVIKIPEKMWMFLENNSNIDIDSYIKGLPDDSKEGLKSESISFSCHILVKI